MNAHLARPAMALAAACSFSLSGPAQATPSLNQTGNLAYSCAGHANGNGYDGINIQTGFFAGAYTCKEAQTLPSVAAKANSHFVSASGGSAKGKGKASFGRASGQGSSSSTENDTVNSVAGFADRWTIDIPGLPAYHWLILTVRVRAKATMEAHGPSGSAGLMAAVYRNGGLAGYRKWGIRSDWANQDVYYNLDEAAGFEFTVYTGDPFYLAAAANTRAGVASLNGVGSAKVTTPSDGLVWDGVVELRDYWTGQVYTDWTLTTESGIDWRQPCPCPLP